MGSVLNEIRMVARSLRNAPVFAAAVILTLGVGLGLNTAVFTMVDSVLLRPLGFHDASRIVAIETRMTNTGRVSPRMGGATFLDLHQVHGLESVAYFSPGEGGVSVRGQATFEKLAAVSPSFTEVMGVEPVAGRNFDPNDASAAEALVSAGFAREHFGSVDGALGKPLRSDQTYTITGVLPDGFSYPNRARVWLEAKPSPENLNRTAFNQFAIGKRRDGVSESQLAQEVSALSAHLRMRYADERNHRLQVVSLKESIVGNMRPVLRLLMGAVALLLLIVCANITHLQLVRSTRLRRAATIRAALGAGRVALARRAVIESLLLSCAGGAVALLIANAALRLMLRMAPPDTPRLHDIHLNTAVLAVSFVVSAAVMLISTVLPVWRSWRLNPATALRSEGERSSESRHSLRLRDALVAGEIALTLTLTIAAVVLARTLIRDAHQQLGFSPEHLVVLDIHQVVDDPFPAIPDLGPLTPAPVLAAAKARVDAWGARRIAVTNAAIDTVRNAPGVLSAAAINSAPMRNTVTDVSYAIRGKQVFAPGAGLPNADVHVVSPNLFSTLGMTVLRGRSITPQDTINTPKVVVVTEALARAQFGAEDPIGRQIMCGYDSVGEWWTIVGVVTDVRQDKPGAAPSEAFYVPVAQHPIGSGDLQIIARTATDPSTMAQGLRTLLVRAHPELAVAASTMNQDMGESERADRFRSALFAAFAGVSVLLAAIGMYGVTAYTVALRRFDFALRLALGAQRSQIALSVLRHAAVVATVGIVFGIPLTFGAVRVIGSRLGDLPQPDAVSVWLAITGVLGLSVIATVVPGVRAARSQPMQVLRSE